jgi:predicted regulator of Ras-like GTPase activity (Roadblock/LC7/MglB family)
MSTTRLDPQGDAPASLDALLGTFLGKVPEATGIIVAGLNGNPVASTLWRKERISISAATGMARMATRMGEALAAVLSLRGMPWVTIVGPTWRVIVAPTPSRAAAVLVKTEGASERPRVKLALPGLLEAVDRTIEGGRRSDARRSTSTGGRSRPRR